MPETRPHATTIAARVLFFAHYRDLTGTRECRVGLSEGATVRDLIARLRADPNYASLPADPLVAVNRDYADPARRLSDGDEVALIPPVSGG